MGRFYTLNAIPRETELNFSFSLHKFIWLEENTPPYSSGLQSAAGRLRMYNSPGEETQLLTLLVCLSSCPLALSFIPHGTYELIISPPSLDESRLVLGSSGPAELCRQIWAQHSSTKKVKSNQVRRASSMPGALPSKHPESCCARSRQAPNPDFGTTPPSLIPCSHILQALVLSGLVF